MLNGTSAVEALKGNDQNNFLTPFLHTYREDQALIDGNRVYR
ncbi:MAG: hypothetical protein SH808_04015 [Saprospiraceae bacterium]|nr:hypothetical protein [Saprospiraceae bacterium]